MSCDTDQWKFGRNEKSTYLFQMIEESEHTSVSKPFLFGLGNPDLLIAPTLIKDIAERFLWLEIVFKFSKHKLPVASEQLF
jgi:hypothetical protein